MLIFLLAVYFRMYFLGGILLCFSLQFPFFCNGTFIIIVFVDRLWSFFLIVCWMHFCMHCNSDGGGRAVGGTATSYEGEMPHNIRAARLHRVTWRRWNRLWCERRRVLPASFIRRVDGRQNYRQLWKYDFILIKCAYFCRFEKSSSYNIFFSSTCDSCFLIQPSVTLN